MADVREWVVDRNADGYPDDVAVRLVLDLPDGVADRAFWGRLLDHAARVGLETHALPLPLIVTADAGVPEGVERVVIREASDVPSVTDDAGWESWQAVPGDASVSPCLTRLFAIDGALEDRDGDLLPDATRIAFDLPDSLPAPLGAALANLAARIGLESGGVTFPLVRDDSHPGGARFAVRPGSGPAALRAVDGGWLAEGDPAGLARLIERVASDWPHLTAPDTGGAGAAIATLRRWLAGDGPEPNAPGAVVWDEEWTVEWEGQSILNELGIEVFDLLDALGPDEPVEITAFVSEPLEQRRQLAEQMTTMLVEAGFPNARVAVLSAFKAGLSWLLEVVVPELRELPLRRVRISYRRHDVPSTLDLQIRWLQELFPGPELMARELGIPLEAIELVEVEDLFAHYVVEALGARNRRLGRWHCTLPVQVQPFVAVLEEDESPRVTVTSGGLVVRHDDADFSPKWVPTDLESFWYFWQMHIIPGIFDHIDAQGGPRAANQPFFAELVAEVWVSEPNERLGIREENDSAAEALAEDIYFTTLDAIELYGQQQTGERCNAPGAVIPIVHVTPGQPPRARVTLRAAPPRRDLPRPDLRVSALRLDGDALAMDVTAEVPSDASATLARLRELVALPVPDGPSIAANVHLAGDSITLRLPLPALLSPHPASRIPHPPPMDANIHGDAVLDHARRLAAFPEVAAWVEDASYQGRPIPALALRAPVEGRLRSTVKEAIWKPTFLVVARHHANEISSTNAALRLAWRCATEPEWRRYLDRVNIILLPYENSDGAALHARLAAEPEARTWKHHAARYNALGFEFSEDMFNPDTRFGEARARPNLWRRWSADVVVDNHGVPSHEWVQPFSGFGSPPRFQVSYWIVQALLYGIVRYVDDDAFPEHHAAALALRDAVSAIVRDTDIGDWNRVYGESYRYWGQSRLPERFPGAFHDDMLWHIASGPADPEGRGFATRYPKTTVLAWVTEVNDETAEGAHLERVARAHLLANHATLDLLHAAAPPLRRWRGDDDGRTTLRVGRERPLRIAAIDQSL